MRFIGVDLAWGWRNPSSLAVLDESGAVVAEEVARSDLEIVSFIAAHDRGGAVLAPLRLLSSRSANIAVLASS